MPQPIQIKRTPTPGQAPTALLPGELAVEMAFPTKLWVGVPATVDPAAQKLLIAEGQYVETIGDTMTGNLTIANVAGSSALFIDTLPATRGVVQFLHGGGAKWNAGLNENDQFYIESIAGGVSLPLVIDHATGNTTFSGNVHISKAWPSLALMRPDANSAAQLLGYTGATLRWVLALGDTAVEAGANTGSNFSIGNYDDAGNYLGNPLVINRATGMVSAPSNWAVAPKDVVTLDYLQWTNTQAGAYVLKTGDTMTGDLTGTAFYANSGLFISLHPTQAIFGANGVGILFRPNYATGAGDVSINTAGLLTAPAVTVNGALAVVGGSTQTGITNNGHLQANGTITATGAIVSTTEVWAHSGVMRFSGDGARYLQWDGVNWNLGGSGSIWHTGNFNPAAYQPAGAYVPISGNVTMTGILYFGSGAYYFNSNGDVSGLTFYAAGNYNGPGAVFTGNMQSGSVVTWALTNYGNSALTGVSNTGVISSTGDINGANHNAAGHMMNGNGYYHFSNNGGINWAWNGAAIRASHLTSHAGGIDVVDWPGIYWHGDPNCRINFNGATGQFYISHPIVIGAGAPKTFVIDHPLDDERYLIHACLEGPSADVFYRGKAELNGIAEVRLPDYFTALCDEETATVMLTPIVNERAMDMAGPVHLAATEVKDGKFKVVCMSGRINRFHWQVTATRKDVAPLIVEPLRSEVDVRGDGPYRYYQEAK